MGGAWGPLDVVWEWQRLVLGGVVEEWRPVVTVFVWADGMWSQEPLGQVWEWQHLVLGGVVKEWRNVRCIHSVDVVARNRDLEMDMG